MDFYIAAILERIVAILMVSVDIYIIGVHKEVVSLFYATVLDAHLIAIPQSFLCIRKPAVA